MDNVYSVSDFLTLCNQTLEYAYENVVIEGEVASFKVNQGKWVFFDLKDEESSVSCFMPLYQLRLELEDGMKVRIRGVPKVTKWGKFSLTARQIMPVGEGSIKKAFEKLKQKLEQEGLFDPAKKRPLPEDLQKIGVISSTGAAGYADFCKIVNARWGGLDIQVCHTQVQGLDAPAQIIRALKYLNERAEVQVIALIRGGGSADDLSCFNDEALVREIASSRIPVITGIGHEVDISLSDLAADVRASTPSNAAELLTKDREAELLKVKELEARLDFQLHTVLNDQIANTRQQVRGLTSVLVQSMTGIWDRLQADVQQLDRGFSTHLISFEGEFRADVWKLNDKFTSILSDLSTQTSSNLRRINQKFASAVSELSLQHRQNLQTLQKGLSARLSSAENRIIDQRRLIERLNPDAVLRQGYSIIAGSLSPGETVKILTSEAEAEAEIKKVIKRKD